MKDEGLLALVGDYPTAVLSWVQSDGYPASVRCRVRRVASSDRVEFETLPGMATGRRGPACLLFHTHDEHLEGLRQMVLKGVLEDGTASASAPPGPGAGGTASASTPIFIVSDVVTANGRPDTDRMPHAGAPLHMLRFYRLGRRQAQAYLRKRGTPWPPIPYDDIARAVRGDPTGPPAGE